MSQDCGAESFAKAEKLRIPSLLLQSPVRLQSVQRSTNENLATGDIEVIAKDIRILAEADTPPFPIEENSKTKEDLRLKYRYLDLRRPDLQKNIMMRSKVTTAGFVPSWQTKALSRSRHRHFDKSTPEGARDYLVPSRIHPGDVLCIATVTTAVTSSF